MTDYRGMNEMEQSACTYAIGVGAKWTQAMDFARWYWYYGSNGVEASWREWNL